MHVERGKREKKGKSPLTAHQGGKKKKIEVNSEKKKKGSHLVGGKEEKGTRGL